MTSTSSTTSVEAVDAVSELVVLILVGLVASGKVCGTMIFSCYMHVRQLSVSQRLHKHWKGTFPVSADVIKTIWGIDGKWKAWRGDALQKVYLSALIGPISMNGESSFQFMR
jgi:hypothetical protein